MQDVIKYYPLTHPQKSIWYTEKMYPNTSIGNVAGTVRFKEEVDFSILEKAINMFIKKNDGMRLRLIEENGEPKQYLMDYQHKEFDYYDFTSSTVEELYKWDENQTRIPFTLMDSDLYYFALVKVNDNDGGFYTKIHHLISDAWTMSIVGNEIVEYYLALKNGLEISDENKPSYLEYLQSEEEYKNSSRFQKDNEYWNNKFYYIQECTTLKPGASTYVSSKSQRKTMIIPKKLSLKITQYCDENKISAYAIFLAALSMYIYRVIGKEDISLGTITLNRSNSREKEMVGVFANLVPISINLNDSMNFKAFAQDISRDTMLLLRHQKYPYDILMKDLKKKHKLSDNLFDIVLTYQNAKLNKKEHKEEYVSRWHSLGHQKHHLMIHLNDREDEGNLIINYDYLTALFHATEIEFMHQHIINLLWHALDNPLKEIKYLNMLSEKEKHKIFFGFNKTKIEYLEDKGLDEGFLETLKKIPIETKSYIFDKNFNLLPIGIKGNLYINCDDILSPLGLERDMVIDSPFEANKKLYNTGILAKWLPQGGIEYLGENITKQKEKIEVRIVATFTSEPIDSYINWWGDKFGYNFKVKFAGYNQVFQELLNPNSLLAKNKEGINALLVRVEDYIRNDNGTQEQKIQKLQQISEELIETIKQFNNTAPLIVLVFPASSNIANVVHNKITELNNRIENAFEENRNVYVVNFNYLIDLYNIEEVYDEIKDKEGHIPYTEEYYAAMGTEIARKIIAIKKQHFKVIVLDCDNTLWKGICGEQGALGVEVSGPYKYLQEFMLEKYNQGMLLAINSKNNENDVFEVFDKNPNMILKRENIINWKANWTEKHVNIREIAKELNLGLDSFIFIDDNPLECSKMVENCPQVLTLQLPQEELIMLFLKHIWAFDKVKITKEDAQRNVMYVAEQKRQEILESAVSLDSFIKNLELKVSMRLLGEDEIERAAQMTQRTNQFNLSTIRRSEEQIRELMDNSNNACFIIEASDRFGDYGIIGLLILKEDKDKLFIDTFLLSCRILGRKVEDVILSGVKRYAKEKGKSIVEALYIPTEKNKPILNFIKGLNWDVKDQINDATLYGTNINALPETDESIEFFYNQKFEVINEMLYTKEAESEKFVEDIKLSKVDAHNKILYYDFELCNTEILEKSKHQEYILPINYFTGKKLLQLLIHKGISYCSNVYEAPRNEIEEKLCIIWSETLKVEKVGIDDNFFELGGDSLTTIQLLSGLYKNNLQVSIQDIYRYPTIRELCQHIKVYTQTYNEDANIQSGIEYSGYSNSKYTKIQNYPITECILRGDLPRIDAVALNYIPDDFSNIPGHGDIHKLLNKFDDNALFYDYIDTGFGNIAVMMLPILSKEIYGQKDKLISLSIKTILLAEKLGAKVVSLTGLIPSATKYGLDVVEGCKKINSKVRITTGHTTTSASVTLSLERLLEESNRKLENENLCVLGLGSIGTTAIKLLLSVLSHPNSITLCDIYEKKEYLEELKCKLKTEFGFDNNINILYSKGYDLPNKVYESSLIIGATNIPNILDINKLKAGTLIVDDSAPHCFAVEDAVKRIKSSADILFTEGGTLEASSNFHNTIYLPQFINNKVFENYYNFLFNSDEITGCILSSLLSAKFKNLQPVHGEMRVEECVKHYNKLRELGFKGAKPHCNDYVITQKQIECFGSKFGK